MTELKITIRGLNHKLAELTLYINEHKPDIVTLNEPGKCRKNTHIPHYKISQPSPNTRRGVAILYRQDINIEQLTSNTSQSTTQTYQSTTKQNFSESPSTRHYHSQHTSN